MRTAVKKISKHWALIWLILMLAALSVLITLGAYTGLKSVKRVVTTKSNPGELFSSNCMRAVMPVKRINTVQYTATVCNYEQKNPLVPNTSNIEYTLTAELKVLYNNGYYTLSELSARDQAAYDEAVSTLSTRTYSICKTSDDEDGSLPISEHNLDAAHGYKATFNSQGLKKDVPSTDMFRVTFSDAEILDTNPDFYVHLKVSPTAVFSDIECLLCATKSTSDVAAWQGAFLESSYTTIDYDFYNYIISGSGIGTLDIMWNPEWFELNKYFYDQMSGNDVVGSVTSISNPASPYNGWKKITLNVDSRNKNRYELQLFKTKEDTSYTGSVVITDFIAFKFTAAAD